MAGAYEIPGFTFTLPSSADYDTVQFRFVTVNSSSKAVQATAAGMAIGVQQNKPKTNEAMTIMVSGISKVTAGEAIAAGDLISVGSAGKAGVAGTTAEDVVGIALTAAGADGEVCTVLLATVAGRIIP